MKNIRLMIIAISILLITSSARAVVGVKDSTEFASKYECDVLPDANGFAFSGDTPPEWFNFAENDILSNDTLSYPGGQTTMWEKQWNASFANGYTVEIKLKVLSSPDTGSDVNRGYWLQAGIARTSKGVVLSFLNDKVMHRAGEPGDEMVIFGDNTNDWHIYRIVVAPGGWIFDVYRDGTLVVADRQVWVAWGALAFGDPTGSSLTTDVSVDIDYLRWDTTGAFYPSQGSDSGVCGGPGTVYKAADLNQDCYVDFADFSIIAESWQNCTDPENDECNN